jgi:hypothetical protein
MESRKICKELWLANVRLREAEKSGVAVEERWIEWLEAKERMNRLRAMVWNDMHRTDRQ